MRRKAVEHQVVEGKPLLPYVTIEEAMAFRAEDEATWTRSPFVNAVLEAFEVVRPTTARNVARYLDLEERDMLSAMRVATGFTFLEFRYRLILRKLEALGEVRKHIYSDEVARSLGFVNRSSLWQFLNNQKRQEALRENGPSRHAKPCPGRTRLGI